MLTIMDSTLKNNKAGTGGGAIYTWYGTVKINESSLTNNNAISGGALYNLCGHLTANYNDISDNTANFGSQVYASTGKSHIDNNWWGSDNKPTDMYMIYGRSLLCVHYTPWLHENPIKK